jgi:hypothetical protein
MKKIILILLVFLSVKVFAQSSTDGIYNTTFGTISLTFETGYEYPNAGIVYGDYKDNGTLTGSTQNNAVELQGNFHNGAAEGKFIFLCPGNKTSFFDQGITSFNGFWGYGTDNKYSDNPNYKWNVLSKISGRETIKNSTNVWSGKWNTTDGNLILQQVGNKVTGTYKGIGTIDAVYSKQTRKLKGKFKNTSTQQTGFFEFIFNGNSFTGKWGWTAAMADGEWNGTKHVKNNKELPKLSSNTTAPPANTSTTSNQVVTNLKKANDVTYECQLDYLRGGYSQDIYGIGWIRLYIMNKNTGKMDMVKPHLFNYLDKYGRVFEIPKEKAVDNAIKSLMPAPIRFKFNPNDYGYNSLDEMKGEAYFEFIFEVKIDGILSDEIAGKKSVRTYIENANIRRRDLSETILLAAEPGFFEIEYDDEDYGIYYSVKKIN